MTENAPLPEDALPEDALPEPSLRAPSLSERREHHPRPQLLRARWTDLTGPWGFAYDDGDVGLERRWFDSAEPFDRTIEVPYPPESPASGIGETARHDVMWYRRTVQISAADRAARLLLHFGAVDYRATVWVNGALVASHEGGHTPFSADITPALAEGAEQVVVVRAEDVLSDVTQPRGKQYWAERGQEVWYVRTSGIWQPVWLEPVGRTYVSRVRWTPLVPQHALDVAVTVTPLPRGPVHVRLRLTSQGQDLVDESYRLNPDVEGNVLQRRVPMPVWFPSPTAAQRLVWSPEHPNLIDAEVELLDDAGTTLELVSSYVGYRSIEVTDGRMVLNGWPYYLRMALHQGYWPDTQIAAPDGDALRRDVEAAKELGFNGLRVHQKVEDPRFLYWCDRLGLLVWAEMPSAYAFSPVATQRFVREWVEVLERDYNSPSIMLWLPFNESWGLPDLPASKEQQAYVRSVYYLTRALDPTRPVVGNDGWEHVISDVWGIHDYGLSGEALRERYGDAAAVERTLTQIQPNLRSVAVPDVLRSGEPLMLTECGGISLPREGSLNFFSYGLARDEEDFLARYADLLSGILDSTVITGFCYTQLTDVEQETNGLLTPDRRFKVDPARIWALTSGTPRSIPAELMISNMRSTMSPTRTEGNGGGGGVGKDGGLEP